MGKLVHEPAGASIQQLAAFAGAEAVGRNHIENALFLDGDVVVVAAGAFGDPIGLGGLGEALFQEGVGGQAGAGEGGGAQVGSRLPRGFQSGDGCSRTGHCLVLAMVDPLPLFSTADSTKGRES